MYISIELEDGTPVLVYVDPTELLGLEHVKLQISKTMRTHDVETCAGEACVIHNPSDHHMLTWPLSFRSDKSWLAERTCAHGIGHPDPDSAAYLTRRGDAFMGVHGCDGCCVNTTTV